MFKRSLVFLLAYALTLNSGYALAQFTDAQKAQLSQTQVLQNPGAESGLARWSETGGGALTLNTTAANVASGKSAISFDASAAADYLATQLVAYPNKLVGSMCEAWVNYKGGGTTLTLAAVDGTGAVLDSTPLIAATSYIRSPLLFFPCPVSGTFGLRVTASADTAVVYVDDAFLGVSGSPVQASGTQYLGSLGTWTISNVGSKTYTITDKCWRSANMLTCDVFADNTNTLASGSAASTAVFLNLPTAYKIDTSALANASNPAVGTYYSLGVEAVAASSDHKALRPGGNVTNDTGFAMWRGDAGTGPTTTLVRIADLNVAQEMDFSFRVEVPIAEWAGSGYAASNLVEYAFNTTTTDASDTTSFGYGPAGNLIPTIVATAVSGARAKRVRFPSTIQPTDVVTIEVQPGGSGPWTVVGQDSDYPTRLFQGPSRQYGISWGKTAGSTTDIEVYFARAGAYSSGVAYGDVGMSYPINAGDRWRALKHSAGVATTFGEVTQDQAGLVKKAGQLLGTNTNDEAAVGYVGEWYNDRPGAAVVPAATATYKTVLSRTLGPGVWLVDATLVLDPSTATSLSAMTAAISLTNNDVDAAYYEGGLARVTSSGTLGSTFLPTGTRRIKVAAGATQVVYLVGRLTYASLNACTFTNESSIRFMRIR